MNELVEETKKGNKEAFTKLVLSIEDDLYKVAKSRLNNEGDIQDAIQNTLIIGFCEIKKLRNNKHFKAWMIMILKKECSKIQKRKEKDNEIIEKYYESIDKEEYIDELTIFDDTIQNLNEKEKKIFELYYKEESSVRQIAKALNINENIVKSSLRRGKQKIKQNTNIYRK